MIQVKPCYEIMNIPEPTDKMGVLKYLEEIGRVCYKSEDKITDKSCIEFINMIKNRKHWAMLEHYIFVFAVSKDIYDDIVNSHNWFHDQNNCDFIHAMDFIKYTYWHNPADSNITYLVSASITALNYLWDCKVFEEDDSHGIVRICRFMKELFPEAIMDPYGYQGIDTSGIRLLSRKEIEGLPIGLRMIHDFCSVKFTVNRGVTHEIVRHRPASYAQESTRYCNYSPYSEETTNGKDLRLMQPTFSGENSDGCIKLWNSMAEFVEECYNKMIALGATPQEARAVLPNSTKADIIMTARMWEWKHFFDMRVPASAHPEMRQVTVPLVVDMNNRNHLFDDQVALISKGDKKLCQNQ